MYNILPNTLFIGKSIIYLPTCHSTNDIAKELLQKQPFPVEGMVVITSDQTAGRGQRGNIWEAEAGKNLTFSVIFSPSFISVHHQFDLSIITCLAISSAVSDLLPGDEVLIKWPNDIYITGKKACGILIENTIQQQRINRSIVGIGLNVNQEAFIQPKAASLRMLLGTELSLDKVLELVLVKLELYYLQLRARKRDALREEYVSLLYRRNETHPFKDKNGHFEGTLLGINEEGKLLVQTSHELRYFDFKEIEYT